MPMLLHILLKYSIGKVLGAECIKLERKMDHELDMNQRTRTIDYDACDEEELKPVRIRL